MIVCFLFFIYFVVKNQKIAFNCVTIKMLSTLIIIVIDQLQ